MSTKKISQLQPRDVVSLYDSTAVVTRRPTRSHGAWLLFCHLQDTNGRALLSFDEDSEVEVLKEAGSVFIRPFSG